MHEIARVTLENEMDLILAHRRSMRLGELAGLSLAAQTSFATAVSEVARNTIEHAERGCLTLQVDMDGREKYIVACIKDEEGEDDHTRQGLAYAKRLVNKYSVTTKGAETSIELFYYFSAPFRVDIHKLDEWRQLMRNEPPVSAYDELKRKNEQLQELSEKLKKSEEQYKILTGSLPLIIFSINTEGMLLYANEWLSKLTGETIEQLNNTAWKNVVHEDDYPSFSLLLKSSSTKGATTVKTQTRIRNKSSNDYLWHQASMSPFRDEQGELLYWIGYIVDIHAQKVVEETLKDNVELKQTQAQLRQNQQMLEKYIEELNRSNQELQQFAFVASHDLQEPVRKLLFYSDSLLTRYTTSIDQKGVDYLNSMQAAAHRMRNLINDLLTFSQINKEEVSFKDVNLNQIAAEACQDLEMVIGEKGATLNIAALPVIRSDERMMRQLFENIISNALKYSKSSVAPVIIIDFQKTDDFYVLRFKDNGIGFNEHYLPQMFTLFQRLHSRENFAGTGMGLAICSKIAEMHGGKIWAEGNEGEGAVFYVSLPDKTSDD
ncbi:MAG: ATP-binding protein [Bacteroidota bacterium]|nr:ATP-binding protein [Bacteroidota bacterium]